MPVETELERLVIRLVGDAEDAIKMYDEAVAKSRSASDDIEKENARMEQRAEQIARSVQTPLEALTKEVDDLNEVWASGKLDAESYERKCDELNKKYEELTESSEELEEETTDLGKVMQGLVGVMTSLGAKAWLQQALGEWQEAETTLMKLTAALEVNGRQVNVLVADYQDFASEMQKVTTMGDDAVLSLIQQAENFGLTGEAAKRATQNVIGAQAAGIPASIRMMAMLEQGNTQMLGRILPGLRGIKDESERAAKAQEMLAKMFKVAEAEAKSSAGQMTQLKNNYGDLMEQFGKIVAEGIKPVVDSLNFLSLMMQSLDPTVKTALVTVAGLTAGFLILATTLPTVAAGISTVTAAMTAFSAAALVSPITYVTVAVAALVGGFILLKNTLRDYSVEQLRINEILRKSTTAVDDYRKATKEMLESFTQASAEKDIENLRLQIQGMTNQFPQLRTETGRWLIEGSPLLAQWQSLNDQLEAAKDRLKAINDTSSGVTSEADVQALDELNKSLEEQVNTLGMDQEAMMLYRLEQMKGTEEEKKYARALIDQLRLHKERQVDLEREKELMKEYATEMEKRWTDMYQQEQDAVNAMQNAMQQRAAIIIESIKTPAEKLADELAEIARLESEGFLTKGEAGKAVDKLTEDFSKTEKQARKTRQEIQRLDNTLFGSAEAERRIKQTIELGRGARTSGGMMPQDSKAQQDTATLTKEIRDILREMKRRGVNIEGANL